MGKYTIVRNGWKEVILPEDFIIPPHVKDHESYIAKTKIAKFVNEHPLRYYKYLGSDNKEHQVDCKASTKWIEIAMKRVGAQEKDIEIAQSISTQFRPLFGQLSVLTRRSYNGAKFVGGVLDQRADELLDLFGKLKSADEVHRIVVQEWGYNVGKTVVTSFYSKHLKDIERLRDQYQSDYSDLALTKKRGRLDKLSVMFYTYFNKWAEDPRLPYAQELRALLKQIKDEVEGERLQIDITGRIDVDFTVEINKTLIEAYRRVPINNLIVAMVAAKKGIDPTSIMSQLTGSFYSSLNGFGEHDKSKEMSHPVDLTYNWNEIQRKHRRGEWSFEEAMVVTEVKDVDDKAKVNTMRDKLLQILEKDKEANSKRKPLKQ